MRVVVNFSKRIDVGVVSSKLRSRILLGLTTGTPWKPSQYSQSPHRYKASASLRTSFSIRRLKNRGTSMRIEVRKHCSRHRSQSKILLTSFLILWVFTPTLSQFSSQVRMIQHSAQILWKNLFSCPWFTLKKKFPPRSLAQPHKQVHKSGSCVYFRLWIEIFSASILCLYIIISNQIVQNNMLSISR